MAPKPMTMMRPGKSLKCNGWVMMQSILAALPASALEVPNGATAAPHWPPARAPLKASGQFGRDGGHALEPSAQRRVIGVDGQEARRQFARTGLGERPQQQPDIRIDHHVGGGDALSDDPVGLRQAPLDGARLAGDM